MNNRAAVKVSSRLFHACGAAALMLSIAPANALPIFDQWTVASGTVDVTCPAGFTCETLVEGDGFAQVQWVEAATGFTYIQTVITDLGAGAAGGTPSTDLPYSDESFIRLGGANGITSRQQFQEETPLTGTIFESITSLNTGWAQTDPSVPDMEAMQILTVDATPAVAGDEFESVFDMQLVHDPAGNVTGSNILVTQFAGLGNGIETSTDSQKFFLNRRLGSFTTAGSIDLDASTFDPTNDPAAVAWNNGDDVMLTWIGQSVNLGSLGIELFGFESIVNFTTAAEAATFSTTSAGITVDGTDPQGYGRPFDWDTTFGATPPEL